MKFELIFHHGRRRFERESKMDEATIQIKPGECRDVGTIELKVVQERTDE